MTHAEILSVLKKEKIIAILRGVPFEKVDNVVKALVDGGVRVLEFTFDHDGENCIEETCRKIRRAVELYGDQLIVGCGTAMNTREVEAAYEAGARLVISPNVDKAVIDKAKSLGMVSMPGALTPTEIVTAYDSGADIVKLFPAGDFGIGYIKSVRAPLKYIPMAAVGGVKPENVKVFLDAGICGFGVGSQLVEMKHVMEDNYEAITLKAKAYTDAIRAWEAEQ